MSNNGTSYSLLGTKSRPVVVFIHGLGLNKNLRSYHVDKLKENYCVLSYDLFGHGLSRRSKEDPSLLTFTEQLYSLLIELQFSKVIIMGFSLGGMIARHFCKTHTSMVKGLAILNSPYKRTSLAQDAVLKRYYQVKEYGPSATIDDAITRWFTVEFTKNNERKIDLVRSWVLANDTDIYSKNYKVLVDGVTEVIGLEEMIQCPTLVVTADQDYGNGPEMARSIASEIANSKVVIINGLRHMALFERPQEMYEHLNNFLAMIQLEER